MGLKYKEFNKYFYIFFKGFIMKAGPQLMNSILYAKENNSLVKTITSIEWESSIMFMTSLKIKPKSV